MSKPIIEVQNLTKSYGTFQAVKDISFTVAQGSLFAFLGTNGAGKSTTISMLCTLIEKDSGTIKMNGVTLTGAKEQHAIRSSIGVVPQKNPLDNMLTVYENIWHRGMLYGLSKAKFEENYAFVSSYLQLEDIAAKYYGKLSGGQRRRADIARALIHKPTILFLDEPTTGLDPHTRIFVWEAIRRLQQETNMTIFLTTHYMEEAVVADRIVVIKEGQLIAEGTPDALKDRYALDRVRVTLQNPFMLEKVSQIIQSEFEQKGDVVTFSVPSTLHALDILNDIKSYIQSFEVIKGSMDDVFIQLNEGGTANDRTATSVTA